MAWSLRISVTALFMGLCANARADVLEDRNSTHYGKVLSIDAATIEFSDGCTGKTTSKISIDKFVAVAFDGQCNKPAVEMVSSGVEAGFRGPVEVVYEINFSPLQQNLWASCSAGSGRSPRA